MSDTCLFYWMSQSKLNALNTGDSDGKWTVILLAVLLQIILFVHRAADVYFLYLITLDAL